MTTANAAKIATILKKASFSAEIAEGCATWAYDEQGHEGASDAKREAKEAKEAIREAILILTGETITDQDY